MPLRIAVACVTCCHHSGICQSGERWRSRPSYTVAIRVSTMLLHVMESAKVLTKVSSITLQWLHVQCTWHWLAQCCLDLYLDLNCHVVQRPAPPLATVASIDTCHCYPEWHNFPVYSCKHQRMITGHNAINSIIFYPTRRWILSKNLAPHGDGIKQGSEIGVLILGQDGSCCIFLPPCFVSIRPIG